MNKLREIECFIAVVEAGSFIRAAEIVDASKTAVSRHVADLEARLGTRLLQRTTRKLSLTESGQEYFERCRQILAELDQADTLAGAHTVKPAGLLRVNAPLAFGVRHLAPLWPVFMREYPDITLDIELSDRLVNIVEEGYDLGIRIARLPDSSLVHRKLAHTEVIACASPAYLAAHGTPAHPAELASHQTISYSYASHKDEWRFKGPDGSVSVKTRPCFYANNGDTCLTVARAGAGIILQPAFLVAQSLRDGELIRLFPDYSAAGIGIYAVYPTRKHLTAKARVLVDFLSDAFANASWARQHP